MDSIIANGTWEVTERPYGCKPVGCKWVFKKKLRPDSTIEKYKARLVAKGYTQKQGEDFFDTYSPVARLTTIRVLLSLAASHGLLVHQMDVKTAFLNGELDEEIYMDQPDGFVVEGQKGKVCKLLKSLYGLKQSPKQWHEKFDKTLTSAGFAVNEADKCVYYRHGGGEGVILCLYVNDILIFGANLEVINEVKSFLSQNFDMKDLGVADVILNIKLIRGENGITLLQSHYVEKILNRFGYIDTCCFARTRKIARNQLEYSQIIGSLMYLASATRPDISFAVSKLSRFTSNPGDDHWRALERVMRYLKDTVELGLHYTGYPAVLEGYSDSNWISDVDEIKATSGYVFTLGGGAVSWRSCKQTILTRSTMEAELTALDTATVEAEWLRDLLMDLPIVEKPVPAILMNCDNQTVIVKVNSSKDNMKLSRHVKLRNSRVIMLDYIPTARNLADPFTKGLSRNVIDNASKEMGLRPMVCLLLCAAPSLVDYSIPLAGVHLRSGEQVSGTSAFDVLHREKATIRFLGSVLRDCSLFVRDGSSSSSLACRATRWDGGGGAILLGSTSLWRGRGDDGGGTARSWRRGRRGDGAELGTAVGRYGVGSPRLQRRATASPDLVSPLGRGDRRWARSSPALLRGPGREVASSGDGGGCGGDEVGDDDGGLRCVPRRRPSSRTSPPRGRRGALVNVPAVNAVPVTPSSMMPATRASRYTSNPCHPGRIWTAGVWRRWLATVVADGGGWTVVAGRGCPWRWRWRWRWWLTVVAGDGGGCGSGGGGCRQWYLWRRWLKAIIRLMVRRRRRRYVEAGKGSGSGEGGVRVRARRGRREQLWAVALAESLKGQCC
uniref:OSJNBa0014K14.1 protein n=1 Tax=Oryza sativa subsp. japonica TaxID=39947 RepID=Q7XQX4_ORYSJ|nr:OSJNBa0014K14.1 [Oryza sativa Japonica Group]